MRDRYDNPPILALRSGHRANRLPVQAPRLVRGFPAALPVRKDGKQVWEYRLPHGGMWGHLANDPLGPSKPYPVGCHMVFMGWSERLNTLSSHPKRPADMPSELTLLRWRLHPCRYEHQCYGGFWYAWRAPKPANEG